LRPALGAALLLVLLWVMLNGIEQWAVGALITAPNHGATPSAGEPPADARLVRIEREGAGIEAFVFEPTDAARATAVILHGLGDQKDSFIGTARSFAREGYRAVIIDLRGHGHSGGDYLSYGLLDADDVGAVLDDVEGTLLAEGDALGPVVIVGPSYGGAVALRFAAQDARVVAVATLSTFASLRGILPNYARLMAPMLPPPPEWFIDWALGDAASEAGIDYGRCDSTEAVHAIRAPILFVHGENDVHIPIENAEALLAACWPEQCHLERRAGRDHISILSDEASWTSVRAFFDEVLAR
jgi:pimeloyl-ACP methyl ester carboxylesterase